MKFLKRATICLSILAMLTVAARAQSNTVSMIPVDRVSVEVNGSPKSGSHIAVDFRSYWNSRTSADGTEILSLWVALPDFGQPSISLWGRSSGAAEAIPGDCVRLGEPVILRSVRFAPLIIKPSFWNGQQWERILSLDVQINASGSGVNEVLKSRPSRAFDKILDPFLVNSPQTTGTDDFDQEHLLIICPDFAEDAISPFIEWKRRKGLECTLATLDDIGISPTDDHGLREFIQEAYDTWPNPPDFVLLAGDETVLPVHYDYTEDPPTPFSSASVPGWYLDDNYFACLEGDDYFPDVILGRWVVNTAYEYTYLTAKFTRYEMQPNLYETAWYRKAIVAAEDTLYYQGDPSMRETKLTARQMMLDYGFNQVDTLFTMGSPSQLTQWINQGRSFLNYRGSGWSMGWAGINYYIDELDNLENSFKLPVITGIGCGVTRFDEPDGNCFGEVWMLSGSMLDQCGSIAFVGPSHNTHTFYNNSLDLGIYSSIFEQGEARIGAALIAGKIALYDDFDEYFQSYPEVEEIVRVAFNQYLLLSDPELQPYTNVPAHFQAEFPATVLMGIQPVTVTVYDSTGLPFEGVQVALYAPGDFQAVDVTGPDGTVEFISEATIIPSYVYLTVTHPNYAAFLDSILVITDSQYVLHESTFISDESGGNGDGALSPGEEINWVETLRNFGILTAPEVQATLSCSHPLVSVIQDEASFGNIAAGDTASGDPDFQLTLAPWPYQIGDEIAFQIDITDAMDSSWTSNVSFPLLTPELSVLTFDPDPEGNGRLDRGETCDISFFIRNTGPIGLSDGTVELHSDDPYVEIVEGSIPCGSLSINQSFASGSYPFVVSISPYVPTMHEVNFKLKLVSNELTYLFADSAYFTFPVGEYGPDDPTSDDNGTYYAYESWDTLYTEAPLFEWFEIDPEAGGPGEVLPFTAGTQVIVVPVPFRFQYWGEIFHQLTVSADGWIAPGYTQVVLPDNGELPSEDGVPGMIAALWDNLWHPSGETGRISTYADPVSGKFYIEYYEISHYSSTMPKETFQIVLCDPSLYPTASGDVEILFYYKTLHLYGISFSTAGIESPDETTAIEFSYNNSTPVTSHGLSDSLAIRWTPDPPLITAIPPSGEAKSAPLPSTLTFNQPYPNPFNPTTVLRFAIPAAGMIKFEVYNINGQRISELYHGILPAGWHRFDFDGSNLGSGVYFARLEADKNIAVRKLLLVK